MPASKTTPKQSQHLKRGFKAEAERIASHYRKALALNEYAPLPARVLAKYLGITILTPQEIPGIPQNLLDVLLGEDGKEQWSAAIFVKNDRKFIIHNPPILKLGRKAI
jgi:hypothetical protein